MANPGLPLVSCDVTAHIIYGLEKRGLFVRGSIENLPPPCGENAPVTMVTSVPWKRERDITEITPLWETPSLQPFLKTYWLTPVNDWPIVAKHANMTSSRGSINAAPATIRQNLNWTPLGWTSSDHGDHRDVSFPLSGNRGYHSNRSVPFQAVTRHHGDYSVMGTLFNPAVREATDSLNQLHSAKHSHQ